MEIRRPRTGAEHRAALARLIDRQALADPDVEERIDVLEDYARTRGLSLEHCLVLAEGSYLHAVCLLLDSPGRTSTVLLSPGAAVPRFRRQILTMLEQAEQEAGRRCIQLLQGMVPPECSDESFVFAAGGFKHLATLLYMQNDLRQLSLKPPRRALRWETYSPQTHTLFTRVLEGTYQDSLDCGSLNGVRDIEDILASHRATGQYDPYYWRVGLAGTEPVGVILLAHMEEQQTFEVVYMGCLPEYRNQGYGASLLAHAVELSRSRGLSTISLSVDEKNLPARKLYESFGFIEMTRREVWIKILDARDQ
jgi:ribosomal protein S18 acetylase RimI-like enzyme